jgi:hypothetical protein
VAPVIFPDVELAVIDYLRPALAANGYPGIRVANSYKGSDVEVWVRRDGGPTLDVVRESARVGVNVFAKGATDQPVSDLARLVSALMRAAADGEPIVRVTETSGPSPIPDTLPRRYLTFDVVVRGTDL